MLQKILQKAQKIDESGIDLLNFCNKPQQIDGYSTDLKVLREQYIKLADLPK